MPRALDRKFIDVVFDHDLIRHESIEIRMKQPNPTAISSMKFYTDPFVAYRRDGSHISIPEMVGDSPKDVLVKLKEYLDVSSKSKNLTWVRYVRLVDDLDVHHMFYHHRPVLKIEEYFFAYDKDEERWYQTATPNSPIPVATENPPTEKWVKCESESMLTQIRELSETKSKEIRDKMFKLKEEMHMDLRKQVEIILGIQKPESQETNEFERILQDYEHKG